MLVAAFDRDRREYMNKLAEWEKKMITENRSGSSRHPANAVQPDTKARISGCGYRSPGMQWTVFCRGVICFRSISI